VSKKPTKQELTDHVESLVAKCVELTRERDEAWLLKGRIFNEIDCRIEHGADSNGHLEAIRNLFKENTNA